MTPLRAPTVPKDVRSDAIEPWQKTAVMDDGFSASSERLQEDDSSEILSLRPVAEPSEEIVVNLARVPLVKRSKRLAITPPRRFPKRVVAYAPKVGCGKPRHQLLMSAVRRRFHRIVKAHIVQVFFVDPRFGPDKAAGGVPRDQSIAEEVPTHFRVLDVMGSRIPRSACSWLRSPRERREVPGAGAWARCFELCRPASSR
jgi:hypothetical protein